MAQCVVCKKYGGTGKVGLGNESTGAYREVEMCRGCAAKGALVVRSLGGQVRVVHHSSNSSQSDRLGAWSIALIIVVAIGSLVHWLMP